MPRRKRPGDWAILYAEVAPWLKAALESQAEAHHRSAAAELASILEENISAKHRTAGRARVASTRARDDPPPA